MSQPEALFEKWLRDLAPHLKTEAKVVRERIIYARSFAPTPLPNPWGPQGDMEVESPQLNFDIDLETDQEAKNGIEFESKSKKGTTFGRP